MAFSAESLELSRGTKESTDESSVNLTNGENMIGVDLRYFLSALLAAGESVFTGSPLNTKSPRVAPTPNLPDRASDFCDVTGRESIHFFGLYLFALFSLSLFTHFIHFLDPPVFTEKCRVKDHAPTLPIPFYLPLYSYIFISLLL